MIVGQASLVRPVLIGLLCEGHVLLEGVPGLGKTLLLRTLGRAPWRSSSGGSSSRPT